MSPSFKQLEEDVDKSDAYWCKDEIIRHFNFCRLSGTLEMAMLDLLESTGR